MAGDVSDLDLDLGLHIDLARDHVRPPAGDIPPEVRLVGVNGGALKAVVVVARGWNIDNTSE